ncbi:MAG: hypothetical protein Q4E36_05740 [Bacillota bacterium]|nr:hypothetical protein [Bacillota bacterium]
MDQNIKRRNIKIGKTLCGLSFLIIVIFALLNSLVTGLLLALPILFCGLVFIFAKRNTFLYCAWVLFFFLDVYLRYGTGITWRLAFLTESFLPQWNYNRLLFAWIELILFVLMTGLTLWKEKNRPLVCSQHRRGKIILAWFVFLLLHLPFEMEDLSLAANIYYIFGDWLKIFLFIFLVSTALRLMAGRKTK